MQAYLSVLCSKTANIHTFKDLKKKKMQKVKPLKGKTELPQSTKWVFQYQEFEPSRTEQKESI